MTHASVQVNSVALMPSAPFAVTVQLTRRESLRVVTARLAYSSCGPQRDHVEHHWVDAIHLCDIGEQVPIPISQLHSVIG